LNLPLYIFIELIQRVEDLILGTGKFDDEGRSMEHFHHLTASNNV